MADYTLQQTVDELGLNLYDVIRKLGRKELPHEMREGRLYVKEDSVLRYMDDLTRAAAPVQRPETRKKIKAQPPQPEEVPFWLEKAKKYWGKDRTKELRRHYGDARLEALVAPLTSYLGEEGAAALVHADSTDSLLRLENGSRAAYFTQLTEVAEELKRKYDKEIPDECSVVHAPEHYLPASLGTFAISLQETPVDEEEDDESYDDLRTAFRNWRGKPTRLQKRVMGEHGLEFLFQNGHCRIRKIEEKRTYITCSSTPSDQWHAGRKVAQDIIKYLIN